MKKRENMNQFSLICPVCFRDNIYQQEIDKEANCHACGHCLSPMHPLEGDKQLVTRLLGQQLPVLVDFWGEWSGPCREFSPLFNEYADKFKGKVIFIKINSEEEQVFANQLHVTSFPTLILFKEGLESQRLTGFINAYQLDKLLK